MKGGLTKPKIS